MTQTLLKGFMLGLAYVAPIGMQNIYVINTALSSKRTRAYLVALITVFFDITLALACFYGIGVIMEKVKFIKLLVLGVGSIAIIYIGYQLIRAKEDDDNVNNRVDVNRPMSAVLVSCLLVTWVNPQAIIDGTLLLGGFRASLDPQVSKYFILGVCLASCTWFLSLTTIVTFFRNVFNSKVIRGINIICGTVLIYYGLKLGYAFFSTITTVFLK